MEEIEFNPIARPISDATVIVRGAYKSYSKNVAVLKGIDLTVSEGSM